MLYSQYKRIETLAGGNTCSIRTFIRAARTKLSTDGRTRAMRGFRQQWLLDGIRLLNKSKGIL
jgi:hypothetical protein